MKEGTSHLWFRLLGIGGNDPSFLPCKRYPAESLPGGFMCWIVCTVPRCFGVGLHTARTKGSIESR